MLSGYTTLKRFTYSEIGTHENKNEIKRKMVVYFEHTRI